MRNSKKNASCGSCSQMINGDMTGNSQCILFGMATKCENKGCYKHVQKEGQIKELICKKYVKFVE